MFGLKRKGKLPAAARPKLDRDERIVAWSSTVDDAAAAVVVTTRGLFLPGRERLGWHEIHKATWSGSRLTVIPAVPVADAPTPTDGTPDSAEGNAVPATDAPTPTVGRADLADDSPSSIGDAENIPIDGAETHVVEAGGTPDSTDDGAGPGNDTPDPTQGYTAPADSVSVPTDGAGFPRAGGPVPSGSPVSADGAPGEADGGTVAPVPSDGAAVVAEGYTVMVDGAPIVVALADPDDVPAEIRDRVTRSVAYTMHHPVPGGGVRVVGRRVSGRDGLTWNVRYDDGTDTHAPDVVAATNKLVADASAEDPTLR